MTRLRVALFGLGMMGRQHLRVLAGRDDVDVVAVVDPGVDLTQCPRGTPLVAGLSDAIHRQFDCAIVAVPTEDHRELALALARSAIPTMIEKPLAATVKDAQEIADAFGRSGVPGCVGHIERFNPAIRALRARLSVGVLGDAYSISTSRQGPFPNRVKDVGVVKDLATHDLDLTSWILGSPYVAVAANTAHRAGRPNEDLVAAIGWMADQTVSTHMVNWLSPVKERQVVVTGERGRFVADTLTADLTFYSNASVPTRWDLVSGFRGVSEGDVIRYAIPKPEPLATEIDSFLSMARGQEADVVDFDAGIRALEVAEALLDASRLRNVVAVRQ